MFANIAELQCMPWTITIVQNYRTQIIRKNNMRLTCSTSPWLRCIIGMSKLLNLFVQNFFCCSCLVIVCNHEMTKSFAWFILTCVLQFYLLLRLGNATILTIQTWYLGLSSHQQTNGIALIGIIILLHGKFILSTTLPPWLKQSMRSLYSTTLFIKKSNTYTYRTYRVILNDWMVKIFKLIIDFVIFKTHKN